MIYVSVCSTPQGKFGFLFLMQLQRMFHAWLSEQDAAAVAAGCPPRPSAPAWPRVRYIATDLASANVDALRQHPCLVPLVNAGVLSFAVFDATGPEVWCM